MSRKMKRLGLVLLLVLNLLAIDKVNASHLMGSDLTWKCVGQDSFLEKLVVYIDCNGVAFTSSSVDVYCASSGTFLKSLNFSAGTPVDVTPVCNTSCSRCQSSACTFPYGINKYTMQGIVNLGIAGSCCSIRLSSLLGSRNYPITTIAGSGSAYLYTEAKFNRCLSPCDNSPTFLNDPMSIVCVGQDVTLSQDILDIDLKSTGGLADSFTYEWAPALQDFNDSIQYASSYAYDKPVFFWGFPNASLPFPRGIHLDPASGDLQFRPMKAEVSVMTVKVNEFRNGVLIAELRREMQVMVITCINNNPPMITTPNNIRSKNVCAGNPISFVFSTTDPNVTDSVKISWNNAISGAVWTTTNGTAQHPTGTLTWTPTAADVSSLPYSFTVTAKDNACPIRASFIQSYQITVKPTPQANITKSDSGCGNFGFKANGIFGTGPIYTWIGNSFSFSPKVGALTNAALMPGKNPYTMTMTANGCSTTYFDTIVADTFITNKLPEDTILCKGSTITLNSVVKFNSGPITMEWGSGNTSFGTRTGFNETFVVTQDTVIWSRASDSTGCSRIDYIQINVNQPIININPIDKRCVLGPTISLNNFVTVNGLFKSGGIWSSESAGLLFDDKFDPITAGVSSKPGWKVRYEYSDTATGCYSQDSAYVTIFALPKPFAGLDDSICTGSKHHLFGSPLLPPGTWRGLGVTGSYPNWSFDPDSSGVVVGGSYELIYHYSDSNQCENEDSVRFTVFPTPTVDAGNAMEFCEDANGMPLTGNPAGGTWTGNGVSGNTFYPLLALSGIHRLTYSYTKAVCTAFDTVSYVVFKKNMPVISLNSTDSFLECDLKNGYYQWFYRPDLFTAPTIISGNLRRINPRNYCNKCSFNVIYTDSNGCATDTSALFKFGYTSVDKSMGLNRFVIYPNPANSQLYIENPVNEPVMLLLYDVFGKNLMQYKLMPGKNDLDISRLISGVYVIRLDDLLVYRLVVE